MAFNRSLIRNFIKADGQSVGASVTDQVVSQDMGVSGAGALNCRFMFKVTSATAGAGVTLKIQHSENGEAWTDGKTVTVNTSATAVWYGITYQNTVAGDQGYTPLKPLARAVITTGAGSAAVVAGVYISQES